MARALQLARRGLNTTTPNPRVGCLIVRDGRVIGEGWHERAGEPHAEVQALANCTEDAAGSTCYVTLEPCSHHGRTPPCSEALINARLGRVIVAMQDPNPAVAGSGLAQLSAAGITTTSGLLETEARQLNAGFCKRMQTGLPRVRSKIAASLDGRTALANGDSRWITGEPARADVHRLRAQSCAILTGIGTVLADAPRLTARLQDSDTTRQPLRVIMDSQLRLPPDAGLLQQPGRTIVMAAASADPARHEALAQAGAEVVLLKGGDADTRLREALGVLAHEYGVNELMVEAGPVLNGSLLRLGLVDELIVYMAPVILGHHAKAMLDLPELTDMAQRRALALTESRRVGADLRLTYYPADASDH